MISEYYDCKQYNKILNYGNGDHYNGVVVFSPIERVTLIV